MNRVAYFLDPNDPKIFQNESDLKIINGSLDIEKIPTSSFKMYVSEDERITVLAKKNIYKIHNQNPDQVIKIDGLLLKNKQSNMVLNIKSITWNMEPQKCNYRGNFRVLESSKSFVDIIIASGMSIKQMLNYLTQEDYYVVRKDEMEEETYFIASNVSGKINEISETVLDISLPEETDEKSCHCDCSII